MWYYVDNGQQQGPFDEARWEGLIAAGTVSPATLVWKERQPGWLPLSQVRGVASGDTCQICQKAVGADNLIELNGTRVCAECKPVALQKLREGITLGGDGLWVDGKKIVTKDGATFPPRCVKCNAATSNQPLKRKLYWHKPWLYILAVIGIIVHLGIIIYVIAAVIMRKQATVHMYLCPKHRQYRLFALITRWAAIPTAMALVFVSIHDKTPWFAVAGSAVLIGGIVVGQLFARITRTTLIDANKTVWLKGAGKEFLASLPPWNGS